MSYLFELINRAKTQIMEVKNMKKRIGMDLSEEEFQNIQEKAKEMHLSLSRYMILASLNWYPKLKGK
jgi:cyclopropane fatty-acyl-phospholipid synthase-like methyltransferase